MVELQSRRIFGGRVGVIERGMDENERKILSRLSSYKILKENAEKEKKLRQVPTIVTLPERSREIGSA